MIWKIQIKGANIEFLTPHCLDNFFNSLILNGVTTKCFFILYTITFYNWWVVKGYYYWRCDSLFLFHKPPCETAHITWLFQLNKNKIQLECKEYTKETRTEVSQWVLFIYLLLINVSMFKMKIFTSLPVIS